jgi:hypothetical protein
MLPCLKKTAPLRMSTVSIYFLQITGWHIGICFFFIMFQYNVFHRFIFSLIRSATFWSLIFDGGYPVQRTLLLQQPFFKHLFFFFDGDFSTQLLDRNIRSNFSMPMITLFLCFFFNPSMVLHRPNFSTIPFWRQLHFRNFSSHVYFGPFFLWIVTLQQNCLFR